MAREFWFDMDSATVADEAKAVLDALVAQQEGRHADMRRYASLYRDRATTGFTPGEWLPTFDDVLDPDRASFNIVRSCVDTAVSRLAMHKPMPRFITSGGDMELAEKARLMERLSLAAMRSHDIYRLSAEAMRDCAVYGVGFLAVRSDGKKLVVQRIHPSRVVVDDQACLDGDPSVMFLRTWVPRDALSAQFPKEEDAIAQARLAPNATGANPGQDMVLYMEAWYLGPSGRHIAFVDSPMATRLGGRGLLVDEEWEGPAPILPVRWQADLMGFWGVGLAEILEGVQLEIHETVRKIQINHNLLAVPYLLVSAESEIPEEVFGDNREGKVIRYVGQQAPQLVTPPAVHPQTYEHLDRLWARGFELAGISQLSATQQKPAGLNSGVALRTYLDVESTRFSQVQRAYEDLFVRCAKAIVAEAARIPGFKATVAVDGKLEVISMADARMAESEYEIQVWPASSLPMTPAGRLDRVIELAQANLVNQDEARELLDMPDLERVGRLRNAAYEDFSSIFEHMLRTGEYIEPLEWVAPETLRMGLDLCASYWHRARLDGVDRERTDLLVRWMAEGADMLNPEQPEAGFDMAQQMMESEPQAPQGGQMPPMA